METIAITAPANVVNWFAIPAADFERAVHFYETIFETALQVEVFGGQSIAVFAHADRGVGGCITCGKPAADGTLVYLNADNRLDRTLELVARAGGSIEQPKTTLPAGMGFSAHVIDCEGNRIGLHANA